MPKLQDFLGAWRLDREIRSADGAEIGRLAGQALFSARAEGGLQYAETGKLIVNGQGPVTAERRYLWNETGGQIVISFDDGRFFHSFAPTGAPEASHFCDPDDYHVGYDFAHWPVWSSRWWVVGPRKDYVMFSRYERAGTVATAP